MSNRIQEIKEFADDYRFEFSIAFPLLSFSMPFVFWFSLPSYTYKIPIFNYTIPFLWFAIIICIMWIFLSPLRYYIKTFQNKIEVEEPDVLKLKNGEEESYFVKIRFGRKILKKIKGNIYEIIVHPPNFVSMHPSDLLPKQSWLVNDEGIGILKCGYNNERELNILFFTSTTLGESKTRPKVENYDIVFYFKFETENEKIHSKTVEIE